MQECVVFSGQFLCVCHSDFCFVTPTIGGVPHARLGFPPIVGKTMSVSSSLRDLTPTLSKGEGEDNERFLYLFSLYAAAGLCSSPAQLFTL